MYNLRIYIFKKEGFMDWFKYLDEEKIIEWRHWLHQHAELSFREFETSDYIESVLKTMDNIDIVRPTRTSVLGVIKGQKPGPVIGLRADIDALPIEEETDVPFRSQKPGVMHACGHDTHAAMLLGAAKVLSQITDQLCGTVKLIFQHAEELTPGGAQEIIATGYLDDVNLFYGSHIMTPYPAGQIYLLAGPAMAAQNSFHLMIQGRGSHGSMPELSIDPIMVGADIVMNLNQIVSRNIGPFENVVISLGRFTSGEVFNVIPDKAWLDGTVRTNTPEARVFVEQRIRAVIDGICKAYGAEYQLNYVHGYPALFNDEQCTNIARQAATSLFEEGVYTEGSRAMGSEDFSYYTQKAPSTFAFIGGGDESDGCPYVNHHPKFKVIEGAFINGTKMYVAFALEAMKSNTK